MVSRRTSFTRHHFGFGLSEICGWPWMDEGFDHGVEGVTAMVQSFPDNEVFQFGNGAQLTSRYCVHFEAMLATRQVVLAMSVVNGRCPPLLSRHACSQLGLRIDCGQHTLSSRKLDVKGYGMKQARNGHYIVPISRFDEGEVSEIQPDFQVPAGTEAFIVPSVRNRMPKRLNSEIDRSPDSFSADREDGRAHARQAHFGEGQGEEARAEFLSDSLDGSRGGSNMQSICGELGHRARECPMLSEPEEAEEEMKIDFEAAERMRKISPPRRGVRQNLFPETPDKDAKDETASLDWDLVSQLGLSQDEVKRRGTRRPWRRPRRRLELRWQARMQTIPVWVTSGRGRWASIWCSRWRREWGRFYGRSSYGRWGWSRPSREGSRSAMEEEPEMAGYAHREGSGRTMGTLRSDATEDEGSGSVGTDVSGHGLLRRGEVQKLKRGARQGMAIADALLATAAKEGRYVVMEVFAGTAMLSGLAHGPEFPNWCATPPVDILYMATTLLRRRTRRRCWTCGRSMSRTYWLYLCRVDLGVSGWTCATLRRWLRRDLRTCLFGALLGYYGTSRWRPEDWRWVRTPWVLKVWSSPLWKLGRVYIEPRWPNVCWV